MKDYSQNGEQAVILDYFSCTRPHSARFLDIGANDGITLSNTYVLALKGWHGVYYEPSPKAAERLRRNIEKMPGPYGGRLSVEEVAIGDYDGEALFMESGEHLGKGDTGLLSSLDLNAPKKWTREKFERISVKVQRWESTRWYGVPFDFVSIDAEGFDLSILKQIDLTAHEVRMLCIEHNEKGGEAYKEMIKYAHFHGMNKVFETHENLIFAL